MRTVSSPSQTEIAKPITQPGWFVEFHFGSGIRRICSFGATTWNGLIWIGLNFEVSGMTGDGETASISIFDADAEFRTLCTIGGGIRNRVINIWEAQYPALAAGDPNQVFYGVGDAVGLPSGRVEIGCARLNSQFMLAPRDRISKQNGFNFLAAIGQKIYWGDTVITLNPGPGAGSGAGSSPASDPLGNIPLGFTPF